MAHQSKDKAIFSFRTALSLVLITLGVILMLFVCMVVFSVPCVSNFYNLLPVYPDAELIEQQSSTLNWMGIGDLEFIYRSQDDVESVQEWYQINVDTAKALATQAQLNGDPIPKTWRHHYLIIESTEGTQIQLTADCPN